MQNLTDALTFGGQDWRQQTHQGKEHIVFRMLTRKSNKTQTKSLPIPMEAGLATRTLAKKQKAVEEQRQLKRLVEAGLRREQQQEVEASQA